MLLSYAGISIIATLLIAPWAIVAALLINRRSRRRQAVNAAVGAEPLAFMPAPSVVAGEPVRRQAAPKPRPRRKLFLSWAAVERAVRLGEVAEEDLSECLFCTSEAENGLAQEFNLRRYEDLLPHFQLAGKQGRLICPKGTRHYNCTTLAQVNRMLEHNGLPRLFVADDSSMLEQIPMYSAVPSIHSDKIEVMWAAHPYRGNWKSCWGAHTDDSASQDDEADEADNDDEGDKVQPGCSWLDAENQPIIDAYRARHPEEFVRREPTSDQEPEDEDNEPWRASLRPDTDEERNGGK